jgi:hypothetical protein
MATWRRRSEAVPEKLARFAPSDWPDSGCVHDALWDWRGACLEWVKEHPDQSLPFGDGGVIGVLRADIAYLAEMPPCPKRRRPAQHNGVYLEPLVVQDCPHKPVV